MKPISPMVKFALEFGPVLAFFVAFSKLKGAQVVVGGVSYSGFIAATAIFIPVLVVCTLILWRLTGRLAPMQIATLVLVLVFGGLSVWLNDPKFFKMKPTLIYLIFAGILGFGLARGRLWLASAMEQALPLTQEGWRALTVRLIGFFLMLALANEVIWRNFSEEAWVNFKTFGLTALVFAFFMAQGGLLKKHALQERPEDQA